ncbi:MAG TPA: sulfate ABC transporter permease subunit CysW [Polyangiaceae bacterium]|nr:sulfate ABC transporter permease subunit CysW [Polyangiaceae bacterium]
MSGSIGLRTSAEKPLPGSTEPAWVRAGLIAVALLFLGAFVIAPLALVFLSAFSKGAGPYWQALTDSETFSAIELTLLTAAIAVPANTIFGIAAAWCVAKYEFWGKSALVTLVDLPFSVSPVISGLVFVLLFGSQGIFGASLREHEIKIIFAVPGIVLATTFVTFPLVMREVLAVMQAQGSDEEEAALTLGASGFQIFWKVTLPKIRWGLFYGVILCNARAMGEFGAVSVVSGHVRGETNTMPLQVEILYNEYNFTAAFAVASLLAALALVTLAVKKAVEWSHGVQERRRESESERVLASQASALRTLQELS